MLKKQYLLGITATLLLAVSALVYLPGLYGPFVFDDMTNIILVPGLRMTDLSIDSLKHAWLAREFDPFVGRPVAMLSFAFNYYFAEFDVFYFKLTNLVIHIVTGISLYVLTLLILRRHNLSNTNNHYESRHLSWLALAISVAWLLHPLNLTSVLYVVQRMTSLCTLFIVLGLIGYCIGREQIIRGQKIGFATITISFFVFGLLSFLSKENGALLIPLSATLELFFFRFAAEKKLSRPFRWFWGTIVILPLLVGLCVLLAQPDKWFGAWAYHQRDFTLDERLLTQTRVLWFYLRLIFFPDITKMSLYHDDFALSHGLLEPTSTLLSLIGILGLASIAWMTRRRAPILAFAIVWFFVGHSMESSVFPLEMIHEHRNYLPQYGMLFAATYFIAANYKHKAVHRTIGIRLGFFALFVTLLAVGTHARSLQWQNQQILITREVMNNPNSPRAHTMLGAWLHERGQYQAARQHLTIASNLTPNQADFLIRLVQNIYTSDKKVPSNVLNELRSRLMHKRVSGVTLWVYEPLLLITRDNPEFHGEIVELYESVISRPDIDFSTAWYEASFGLLAENYAVLGKGRKALEYYDKARTIVERPRYAIGSAKLFAEYNCKTKAKNTVSSIRERWPALGATDEKNLQEVETILKARKASTLKCTL